MNIMNIINNYNKCKLIDYIVLFNLILKNKNIYFPNILYKEFCNYLIPYIEIKIPKEINVFKYSEKINFLDFISKYNIKNKLFNFLDKNINALNTVNFLIYLDSFEYNKTINFKIEILDKFLFFNYRNILFKYSIPIKILHLFNINKLNYRIFNKNIFYLWMNSGTLLMDDYIYSSPIKKILYYEFFKKIIKRYIL
jgi:hypothetical protein